MDRWEPSPSAREGRAARQDISSDDDDSPGGGVRVVGGALLSGGQVVRHVDSFVRSTRHCSQDENEAPYAHSDDEGSPRSRRLTFEFRNFNLYPDPSDSVGSPALLEKRRPSRSLDLTTPRPPEREEEYGYMSSPTYAQTPYYSYPQPSSPRIHPYRSTQSPRVNRRHSDAGQGRIKKVVTLREAVPVPIREDDASSELSEPEDADGPSKSGDSSNTTQRRRKLTRTRKKKPYKSRRCDICNKTFTKECDVTRHRRTAHGEDEIEFKCHECGRLFNRKDALERHYKVYEGTPHVARRYQPKTYLGQQKK